MVFVSGLLHFTVFSKFILVVACILHTFLRPNYVLLYGQDYILLIHSSVNRQLGFFHFWVIMNNAAINISVQVFVWTYVFIPLKYVSRSGVMGLSN